MKLLVRFGNGPTRSLNRLVGAILAVIVAVGFFCLTDWQLILRLPTMMLLSVSTSTSNTY